MLRLVSLALLVFAIASGLGLRAMATASQGSSILCPLEECAHDHEDGNGHSHPANDHDHPNDCQDDHHHHHGACCLTLPVIAEPPARWQAALFIGTIRPEWPPAGVLADDPYLGSEKPPLI